MDISATALSQYIHGKARPGFDKLVALANFFDVSLDYLVFGEVNPNPADQGPIVQYIEQGLAQARVRASRHGDLVTRIGRVLADRINDVARELADSNTAGREGLIQLDELMRIERYCLHADIAYMYLLDSDVIRTPDGGSTKGMFLDVVAQNIRRGCSYRFLLLAEDWDHSADAAAVRELLGAEVGADYVHEYCAFRQATQPSVAGICLYRLNGDALRNASENEMLLTQFAKYIGEGDWLGCVLRANNDSNADMLMDIQHMAVARKSFDTIWMSARPV